MFGLVKLVGQGHVPPATATLNIRPCLVLYSIKLTTVSYNVYFCEDFLRFCDTVLI